jgi:excisionase family DNA binding protein
MNEHDELLTIPEVAATLRIRPSAVRRWIHERKITIVHVGRLVRVPSAEVDRLVREGTRLAKPR